MSETAVRINGSDITRSSSDRDKKNFHLAPGAVAAGFANLNPQSAPNPQSNSESQSNITSGTKPDGCFYEFGGKIGAVANSNNPYFGSREFILSLFALVNIMLFELLLQFSFFSKVESELRRVFLPIHLGLSALSAGVVLASYIPTVLREVRQLQISNTFLVTAGLLILTISQPFAIASGVYAGSFVDIFTSLPLVCFLVVAGQDIRRILGDKLDWQQLMNLGRNNSSVRELTSNADSNSEVRTSEPVELDQSWIALENVRVGNTIRVDQGELLSCDGTVVGGQALLLEGRYPGLSPTRVRSVGEQVWAGSRIIRGTIDVRVAATYEDSSAGVFQEVVGNSIAEIDCVKNELARKSRIVALVIAAVAFVLAELLFFVQTPIVIVLRAASSVLLFAVFIDMLQMWDKVLRRAVVAASRMGCLFRENPNFDGLSSIRTLAIDSGTGSIARELSVKDFELMDDRIDRQGLLVALLAVCGKMECAWGDAFADFAAVELKNRSIKPVRTTETHYYGEHGGSAIIEGLDVTIGTEELLIERGVEIDPAAVSLVSGTLGEQNYYLAFGSEIVARFVLHDVGSKKMASSIAWLRKLGVKSQILGREGQSEVDAFAEKLGTVRAAVHSNLTNEKYLHKIEDFRPVALLASIDSRSDQIERCDLSIGFFDYLLCDTSKTEVTIFSSKALEALFLIPWRIKAVLRSEIFIGVSLLGIGVLLIWLFGFIPALSLAIVILSLALNYLVITRLIPISSTLKS